MWRLDVLVLADARFLIPSFVLDLRTPSMHSRTLLAAVSTLLGFMPRVAAQIEQAECPSGWEWNQNSLGQDPCTIASLLDANCRGVIVYPYPKLNQSEWYVPPKKTHTGDTTCDCNTVVYSLVMACSTCQGGLSYGWDKWEQECGDVLISDYSGDIPQGTAIPHWAFYNVTLLSKEQFDNTNAQSIGRDPEAMPTPPKSSAGPNFTGQNGKHSGNTAAIVGGVIGGVGGFILISIAVFFGILWWRKNEKKAQGQWDFPGGYDANLKMPPQSPTTASYAPSISTGPTFVSHPTFQPYASPPHQPNRVVTYVTPIANNRGGS